MALETNYPDIVSHSARWLASHGRDPNTYWLGEVDYTGPCDRSSDADCDHWFDAHDNCPKVFNPAQEDTRDSGMGDACYRCLL